MTENERFESMVQKLGLPKDHVMTENVWSAISFFLSQNEACLPHPSQQSALDLFSLLLSKRLKYDDGERDLVAMHHEFGVEHRSGKKVRIGAIIHPFFYFNVWVIGNFDIYLGKVW